MNKVSYHFGINKYPAVIWGHNANLRGCINDAVNMQSLCKANGFTTKLFTDGQVNSKTFAQIISDIAKTVKDGTVVLTYSGHGIDSKINNGTKTITGICLSDRVFWDFEMKHLLALFEPTVTVIWISDSCFSEGNYRKLKLPLKIGCRERLLKMEKIREKSRILFEREAKLLSLFQAQDNGIKARVIALLSSQDTETSLEVYGNGVFTSAIMRSIKKEKWTDFLKDIENSVKRRTEGQQNPAYEFINISPSDLDVLLSKPFLQT